ncbi:methylated-DNA-[protein]-cysteine S-methyltransferase/DNA-3-methyladenine glycosylase II [Streptomyces sp. DvalAA-14]|uniref:DNA-3-methyladenine glycosylase family protein n=1 Tax=unclassified Streptomyces TaxID=2593676 RepID=UPI00081B2440|nr:MULTISPECIES: DNA-3-methyladenine glycosylase [unclassified Streptomyces]MYS23782.1 hypothetical protein [Streptomyces sp. SID4948]SCE38653.1 methylated-DNA-[protein]-cysteine S-methyltransferase/DNA-3-methyladenine glycosylase II [Streptomyces sp. DvalAA-14]
MTATATAAHAYLADSEPVFARLIDTYGPQNPFAWHDGGRTGSSRFAAMVLHIVGQRTSALAGFTLFDRIADATGGIPSAEGVLGLGADRLRGFGLPQTKTQCLLDFAHAQTTGSIDVEAMDKDDDTTVLEALTAIRGIGRWSAQAFLMRQLHRPDVLPPEDMGIRQAVAQEWRRAQPPTAGEVRSAAEAWSPYRSYASALLWRSLKPVGELSDPKARALEHLAQQTGTPEARRARRARP